MKEIDELLNDKHTAMTFTTNDNYGEKIIVMNAMVRPQSPLREKFLNPHRNIGNVPAMYVRKCPKCDSEWQEALSYYIDDDKMKTAYYHCCGIAICENTYNHFVRRVSDKVDILPTDENNMTRGTESTSESQEELPSIVTELTDFIIDDEELPTILVEEEQLPVIVIGESQSTGQKKKEGEMI